MTDSAADSAADSPVALPDDGAHLTLTRGGATIAYRRTPARHPVGRSPGVMFLGGYMSDMTGIKARTLEAWAVARGIAFVRFDYQGHGASGGRFEDGTVGAWADDAVAVLDAATEGPQVLVGSSLGGWIMTLAALRRPQRVAGLVGIAAAADFTEDLMWGRMDEATRATLLREGRWYRPSQYFADPKPVTRALIEEGRNHLLLRGPVAFDGPVRLVHGMRDADVPWQTSQRLAEALTSDDVRLTLVKDGEHRLSRPQDLALIERTVAELIE